MRASRFGRGEILGVAGVAGNGQDELIEALIGLRKPSAGKVTLDGRDVTGLLAADDERGRAWATFREIGIGSG